MSNAAKSANSNWESTVKPILVLTVSSLVVSLLLALVNSVTRAGHRGQPES